MSESEYLEQVAENQPERPPWYRRAFELFRFEHFDSDTAAMLARSEWNERQKRQEHEAT